MSCILFQYNITESDWIFSCLEKLGNTGVQLENQGEGDYLKTKGLDGNNIKRDLKEIGLAYVEWIHLAQDGV
jgi:hypothetical protein